MSYTYSPAIVAQDSQQAYRHHSCGTSGRTKPF